MMDCTTMDCGNTTAGLYLCKACISDLEAWIEKAHELAPELDVTIARRDVLRKAGSEGGQGGKAGSRPPVNLHAVELQANLYGVDRNAEVYAHDQAAAMWAWTIQEWVTTAERLISGPEPERVDHEAIRKKVQDIAPAMPTRQLIPWLREKTGAIIKRSDINHWQQRGKLRPVERDPLPTYLPHEVLALLNDRESV